MAFFFSWVRGEEGEKGEEQMRQDGQIGGEEGVEEQGV
jgi:hypothetical protein